MTFIIFVIILGLLVLVHELGHFLAAKKAGVQVEEFGFGYPPRALKLGRKWGTLFSLNWIPFGGFVKIVGENYEENSKPDSSSPKVQKYTDISLLGNSSARLSQPAQGISESFGSKNLNFMKVSKKWQAIILVARVTFNIIFAWFLFSLGFVIGLPTPVENNFGAEVKNPALTIIEVLPQSPAATAGLKTGDKVKSLSVSNGETIADVEPQEVSDFINESAGEVMLQIDRGGEILDFSIIPETGLVEGKKLIGISMDMVGILSLPVHKAFWEGGKVTFQITYLTIDGLYNLVKDAVKGEADISQVTGPVGIIGLVGDASRLGLPYLITFTALISINLAIINLIPFPALDGGRFVFVVVEAIAKKPINAKFIGALNTIGFALLIILMLVITYRDILNLF